MPILLIILSILFNNLIKFNKYFENHLPIAWKLRKKQRILKLKIIKRKQKPTIDCNIFLVNSFLLFLLIFPKMLNIKSYSNQKIWWWQLKYFNNLRFKPKKKRNILMKFFLKLFSSLTFNIFLVFIILITALTVICLNNLNIILWQSVHYNLLHIHTM